MKKKIELLLKVHYKNGKFTYATIEDVEEEEINEVVDVYKGDNKTIVEIETFKKLTTFYWEVEE